MVPVASLFRSSVLQAWFGKMVNACLQEIPAQQELTTTEELVLPSSLVRVEEYGIQPSANVFAPQVPSGMAIFVCNV